MFDFDQFCMEWIMVHEAWAVSMGQGSKSMTGKANLEMKLLS